MKNIENHTISRRDFLSTAIAGVTILAGSLPLEEGAPKATQNEILPQMRKVLDGHAELSTFESSLGTMDGNTLLTEVGVTEWHFPDVIKELRIQTEDVKKLRENTHTVRQLQDLFLQS